MSLTPTQHRRFARHTLLSEIGTVGQERLCAATVVVNSDGDPAAVAIARDYLLRAGVNVGVGATDPADSLAIAVAATGVVDRFASTQLRHAAAAIAGAFAAVEGIKALVGAGTAAVLPASFRLIQEEP